MSAFGEEFILRHNSVLLVLHIGHTLLWSSCLLSRPIEKLPVEEPQSDFIPDSKLEMRCECPKNIPITIGKGHVPKDMQWTCLVSQGKAHYV